MTQLKRRPIWAYLPDIIREAVEIYIQDHDITISEFIRSAVYEKLIAEGYVTAETLKEVVA